MFVKKLTSWRGRGFGYPRDLFVVYRRFEVRQWTLVPIDARDRTLVLARDRLELVVDLAHHLDVDGVGVTVKLRAMNVNSLKLN